MKIINNVEDFESLKSINSTKDSGNIFISTQRPDKYVAYSEDKR